MKTFTREMLGWSATKAEYANTNRGIVIHYDGSPKPLKLAEQECTACRLYWQRTRRMHMRDRGWLDIGYSYGVCPHGNLYVGRGMNRVQAAQPGGNRTWVSVSTMLGVDERPTEKQINGIRELRQRLIEKGLQSAVSYHGKFVATDCPGNYLFKMVRDGVFNKKPDAVEEKPHCHEEKKGGDDK